MEANPGLVEQLRVVFNACDSDVDGKISLSELANMSRNHVDGDDHNNQVEQILEILNIGDDGEAGGEAGDRIDFQQFCQKMMKVMAVNSQDNDDKFDSETEDEKEEEKEPLAALTMSELKRMSMKHTGGSTIMMPEYFSPTISDQGAFNENLKMSFEKTRVSVTSSPNYGSKLIKRKPSQSRMTGNIPLVNTSSEDEAEDSFDRKIAQSLSVARPMELQPPPSQPHFLVRGSSLRTTVKIKQKSNPSSPNISASSSSPRPSKSMYPEESDSSSRCSTSSESSATNTPSRRRNSHNKSETKLMIHDLERKVEELADNAKSSASSNPILEEYESQSSGVDSLKADLEEEISSSMILARKHGEERLQNERRRHSEQMDSMERERDLERRNFQLRYEQMQEERDSLKKEVSGLKDKVGLLNVEKNLLEEQMMETVQHQAIKEEENKEEEMRRRDREEELLMTVKTLSERVANQDQQMAELKEDNILLKKQLKEMAIKETKTTSFRIFGGTGKENISNRIEDPQDIRSRLRLVEKQLLEQVEANNQMKQYMGDVLVNVMTNNPQILEKNN